MLVLAFWKIKLLDSCFPFKTIIFVCFLENKVIRLEAYWLSTGLRSFPFLSLNQTLVWSTLSRKMNWSQRSNLLATAISGFDTTGFFYEVRSGESFIKWNQRIYNIYINGRLSFLLSLNIQKIERRNWNWTTFLFGENVNISISYSYVFTQYFILNKV